MATWALIVSLIGIPLCFCGIPSIVGIILGVIAMRETKRTGEPGYNMALASVIVGALTLMLLIVLYIIGATSHQTSS